MRFTSRRVQMIFKAEQPVTRRSNRRKRQKQTGRLSTLQALQSDRALAASHGTAEKVLLGEPSGACVHLPLSPLKENVEEEQQEPKKQATKKTLGQTSTQGVRADSCLDNGWFLVLRDDKENLTVPLSGSPTCE